MKILIERDNFLAALSAVRSVAGRGNIIPILANVKLEAAGGIAGALRLTCHSLDYCGTAASTADVERDGATTVEAQRLHDLLSSFPRGSHIAAEADDTRLTVACGRSRYRLQTLPVEDFPAALDIADAATSVVLDAAQAEHLFRRTFHATSAETTRFYLNGALLHSVDGMLIACATDGVVLSIARTEVKVGKVPGVIVPRAAMTQIAKMAQEGLTLSWDHSLIRAEAGHLLYVSKLVDGTFPDYPRVVPAIDGEFLDLDRAAMISAFERLDALDANGPVECSWEKGAAAVTLKRVGVGEGADEIECQERGDEGWIPLGIGPTLATLSAMSGDTVRIHLPKDNGAAVFLDPEDGSVTAVVMPFWMWKRSATAAAA